MRLLERNFCCRLGEIDLIMQEGQTLVFVEVRLRRSQQFGGAAASITHHKQQKLLKAAQIYLQKLKTLPPCRFDVVVTDGDNMEWIKDAFGA
jgi:putative endonuclease